MFFATTDRFVQRDGWIFYRHTLWLAHTARTAHGLTLSLISDGAVINRRQRPALAWSRYTECAYYIG